MTNIYEKYQEHLNRFRQDEYYIKYFVDLVRARLREIPEELEDLLNELHHICKEEGYESSKAEIYLALGWIYYDRAIYKQAIELYIDAKRVFEKYEDDVGLGRVYNAILMTYFEQGRLEEGVEYGVQGLELAKKTKDTKLEFGILFNMTIIYLQIGEIEKAEDLIRYAEDLSYLLEETNKGLLKKLKAGVLLHQKKYTEALKEIIEVEQLFEEKKLIYLYAETFYLHATILLNLGRQEEATHYLEIGLEYTIRLKQNQKKVDIYRGYSKLMIAQKDYLKAENYILQALEISKKLDDQLSLQNLYNELSVIYKYQKNYQKALQAYESYSAYKKYIFSDKCQKVYEVMTQNNETAMTKSYANMYKKIDSILQVGQLLTSKLTQKEIINVIQSKIKDVIKQNSFSIGLFDQQSSKIKSYIYKEDGSFTTLNIDEHDEESISAYCFRNKKDIIIYDVEKDYGEYAKRYKCVMKKDDSYAHSILYCPLIVQGKVIGIFSVQHDEKNYYTLHDLNTLKLFASYIATALWNARLFAEVQYLAEYDGLTKVLNRKTIMTKGAESFKKVVEEKSLLSVIMMDLDYFKKINDTYGHDVGDRALQHFVGIVKSLITKRQEIGRYGGEEFILVADDTDHDEIMVLAESIRSKVQQTVFEEIGNTQIYLTVSLGVYTFSGQEKDFYEGVKYADIALYEAKESGRNTVVNTVYKDVKDYSVNKKYVVTKEGDNK